MKPQGGDDTGADASTQTVLSPVQAAGGSHGFVEYTRASCGRTASGLVWPAQQGVHPHEPFPIARREGVRSLKMRQAFSGVRKGAIALVGAFSVVVAMFLIWQLATPERIGTLSNGLLAGMLALVVLPGVTLGAWELDRRASLRRADLETHTEGGVVHAHGATAPQPGARPARQRGGRHRRRVRHLARAGVRE